MNLSAKTGDVGLVPGLRRFPGEGNGNLLQYAFLGNPMDKGALRATVHGITQSRTWLSDWTRTINCSLAIGYLIKGGSLPLSSCPPCCHPSLFRPLYNAHKLMHSLEGYSLSSYFTSSLCSPWSEVKWSEVAQSCLTLCCSPYIIKIHPPTITSSFLIMKHWLKIRKHLMCSSHVFICYHIPSVMWVYVPRFFVSSQQRFGAMDIKALGASQLLGLGQTVLQLLGKSVLQLYFI